MNRREGRDERRLAAGRIALFSGPEWEVDLARGLNGYCDFLLTRGGSEHILRAPFVAVVEAKNDLIRTGLGQCIAAMVAARVCHEQAGEPGRVVHGVVGTGAAWKFIRLDRAEYFIDDLPKIMGILVAIVGTARG